VLTHVTFAMGTSGVSNAAADLSDRFAPSKVPINPTHEVVSILN